MALGSPTGSPSTGPGYLPSYLMGEPNVMAAPRSNTFSPTKGRSLAFGGKCTQLNTYFEWNQTLTLSVRIP